MAPAPSLLPAHFETAEVRTLAGVATVLQHILVSAHERFVKHNLKQPLHYEFFGRTPGAPLGKNSGRIVWRRRERDRSEP